MENIRERRCRFMQSRQIITGIARFGQFGCMELYGNEPCSFWNCRIK